MFKIKYLLVTSMMFFFISGCSMFARRGTPEAHQTVVTVATQYLGYIVLNNKNKIDGMVLWLDYIDQSRELITKELCFAQMNTAAKLYNKDNHPLVHLSLLDVEVRGNNAGIILRKKEDPDAEEIEISMRWIGNGWLIIKDNIFGSKGILADAIKKRS